MLRKLLPTRLAALALLALLAAGCGVSGPMSTVTDPKGPIAQMQLSIFHVTLWVSVAIFLVVGSLMLYALFRFPAPEEGKEVPLPPQTHGNVALEVSLTLLSILLVGIIAFPTVQGIFTMSTLPEGETPLEVNVVAYQWWWSFEYPKQEGFDTPLVVGNEFAIPTGRPIKINLKSADIIHSFWVPKLAGKLDVMPNQNNWLWLEADEPGVYLGQCAEFCGESHAYMRFRVQAMAPAEFEAWARHQKTPAVKPASDLAKRGEQLFSQKKCWTCHTVRGTRASFGKAGPDLTHFASRGTLAAAVLDNTDQNVRDWIANNYKIKPGNYMFTKGGIATKDEEAMAYWKALNEQIQHWNVATLPADVVTTEALGKNPGLAGLQPVPPVPEPELTAQDVEALVAYLRTLK